jgi:excisionase family DNA binding protein
LSDINNSIAEYQISASFFENRIVCEWLSSKEAAFYLGISENALRIIVCRGQIKYSKFGRRLRFRFRYVESLLVQKGSSK